MPIRVRTSSRHRQISRIGFAIVVLALGRLPAADAQTAAHGYVVGGAAVVEGAYDDGSGTGRFVTFYERMGLIGGGFVYPLWTGRMWIAGDLTSRASNGYLDASGGPAIVVGLGSTSGNRLEPFAHAGPRWGDGGLSWNAGGGAHLWSSRRVGLRFEYQYQWTNTTMIHHEGWGPRGPTGPPVRTDTTVDEHLIRVGVVFR